MLSQSNPLDICRRSTPARPANTKILFYPTRRTPASAGIPTPTIPNRLAVRRSAKAANAADLSKNAARVKCAVHAGVGARTAGDAPSIAVKYSL
jgi:hypothetical protein